MATLDSTGSEFYLVPTTATLTTKAECTTAIATAKRIKNLKTFGDIGGTRAVSESKFLSADDSVKSMGSISYGNMPVECLFDANDTEGQSILKTAYEDKSERKLIIANTDTTFTVLNVKISASMKTYNIDEFVIYKATIEQNSEAVEIIA